MCHKIQNQLQIDFSSVPATARVRLKSWGSSWITPTHLHLSTSPLSTPPKQNWSLDRSLSWDKISSLCLLQGDWVTAYSVTLMIKPRHVWNALLGNVTWFCFVFPPLLLSSSSCSSLSRPFGSRLITRSGIVLNSLILDFSWPNTSREQLQTNQVQHHQKISGCEISPVWGTVLDITIDCYSLTGKLCRARKAAPVASHAHYSGAGFA